MGNGWDVKELNLPAYPGRGDDADAAYAQFHEFAQNEVRREFAEEGADPGAPVPMSLLALISGQELASYLWLTGRIKQLEARIGELESGLVTGTRWAGVWQRTQPYRAGELVTCKSALWHANSDSKGIEPGDAPAVWTLCSKNGEPPKSQRESAGRRITGNEPPRKKGKRERTTVTDWTPDGRIKAFEKEEVTE